MGFLASAKPLFIGLKTAKSYHQALEIESHEKARLLQARRAIRTALRTSAAQIRRENDFWAQDWVHRHSYRHRPDVKPKFFTQGSFAYQLLVAQAHKPPQELDLDDGMYLLVDFLDNGQPTLVARALFQMVEESLRPLCNQRGWRLDDTKDSCVRVRLNNSSHIDIPIYSAPRESFSNIPSAAHISGQQMVKSATGRFYPRLPSNRIMLAQRNGTWQQSDPLKLHEWVESCVTRYGETFRRACRYFKGWRDNRWPSCCLSSITIMVAVASALEQMNGDHRELDDDQLVYEVALRLPQLFRERLINPTLPGQDIVLNDWLDEDRSEIVGAAEAVIGHLNTALKGTLDREVVVKEIQSAFGSRIPYRPDAVVILPPVALARAREAPAQVPTPKIVPSTSG